MRIKYSGTFYFFPKLITQQLLILGEPSGPKKIMAVVWLCWVFKFKPVMVPDEL